MRSSVPMFLALLVAAATSLASARPSSADTLHLRDGRTVVGDVVLEGEQLVVTARFPTLETLRLTRSELTPDSLIDVLDRRTDLMDVAKRRELAELAAQLGLPANAIAEYRRIRGLDPALAPEMDKRIAAAEETFARDLLEEARATATAGMLNAAVVRLHVIAEQYPATKAGHDALAEAKALHRRGAPGLEVAGKTVDAAGARALAERVDASLRAGRDAAGPSTGHAGAGGTAEQRALERALAHDREAWESAKRLPVSSTGDTSLDARLIATRKGAKEALVSVLLRLGTVHLERRALPSAEGYCDEACELDAANADGHALHRLLLQAKATLWGRRGSALR